jgi:NitT/TauT family transport system ATP-binding protein
VLENVTSPTGCGAEAAAARIAEVGLAGREGTYPRALSLGQQRRVALARAFAARPQTLLLDEPFVSLDAEASAAIQGLLARLIREHPVRTLLVTHAPEEALRLADRAVLLAGEPAAIAREVRIARPRAERDGDWLARAVRGWREGTAPGEIA